MVVAEKEIVDKMYIIFRKACDVMNNLRGGLQESAYHAALDWELNQCGMKVLIEQPFNMWYRGHQLSKTYKLDLVIDDNIIIELKAKEELTSEHRLQLFNYMRLTKVRYGMLINFGYNCELTVERYMYQEDGNTVILIDKQGNAVFENRR